jgi:hypothetical protein
MSSLLTNGKVLIAGGSSDSGHINKAELYDPSTGTWTTTDNMNYKRSYHIAFILTNGKVLVAGGYTTSGDGRVNTAELY